MRTSKRFTHSLMLVTLLSATLTLAFGQTASASSHVQSNSAAPLAQRRRPTPTPLPSPTPAAANPGQDSAGTQPAGADQKGTLMKVQGIVCVDRDRNGTCGVDEPRIPNVIVRATDGSVTASDAAGQFTVRTSAQSPLNVVVPGGYTSADGRAQLQVQPAENLVLAFIPETAPTAQAPLSQPQSVVIPTVVVNAPPSNSNTTVIIDTVPILIGAGVLGLIILVSVVIIRGGLGGMNKTFQQQVARQDAQLAIQHNRESAMRMQLPNGWQQIAERLVADALLETVSIDDEAGIIDASTYPAPKFTVVARDGREFVFTIDPKTMKKMKLLKKGDRIIEITSLSPTAQMDVQTLWDFVVNTRNMWTATPPGRATWYVIVREGNRRASPPPMYRIGSSGRRMGGPAQIGAPNQAPPPPPNQQRGWGQ